MKINIILNSYPRESETFLTLWIANLLDSGVAVRLVLMKRNKSNNHHFYLDTVEHVFSNSLRILIGATVYFVKGNSLKTSYYMSLFGDCKPNVIHFAFTSLAVVSIDSIMELQRLGIKILVSCRGHSENVRPYINTVRKEQLIKLFVVVDRVHCVSQEMEDRMSIDFGLNKNKSFVNEPAIQLDKFEFKAKSQLSSKLVLITNGRLVSIKGYIFSLLAIKKLVSDGVNLEYRIIGSGAEEDNLLFYIHRLNLTNHVSLLGAIHPSEVIKELSKADIYIACTLTEGLSNAVIESMAVGTPVISTNVNGMPELIDDGINGILVNPFSDIEIYNGIIRFIRDPEIYRCFSVDGRKKVEERFDIRRQNEIFLEEYFNLLRHV